MFHKLLGEASDDLERVSLYRDHADQTTMFSLRDTRENPCFRPGAPSEKSCFRSETLTGKLCSRFEMPKAKSVWQTSADTPMPHSSAGSLEQADEGDPRKQLELSVPGYELGEWKYEFKMSSFTTTMLNLLFTEAEQNGKTRNFRIGLGSDGSSADKLSLDLKFNPWDTAITFRPEWRSMSKTVFTQYDPFET